VRGRPISENQKRNKKTCSLKRGQLLNEGQKEVERGCLGPEPDHANHFGHLPQEGEDTV
jgi:hypothetical protein